MAGVRHEIEVDPDEPGWRLLLEVAEALPAGRWGLVGGLMVHAHAVRAGMAQPRPTADVDAALDLGTGSVADIAGPLHAIGFRPQRPSIGRYFHRFVRGTDKVDILIGNDAPRARWAGSPVLRSPGVSSALSRLDVYAVRAGGRVVEVGVPDSVGALIAKGAAYSVDRRDRERHIEDFAVLLAAATRIDISTAVLTAKERKYLRPMIQMLADAGHPAWVQLDPADARRGQAVLQVLVEAVDRANSR